MKILLLSLFLVTSALQAAYQAPEPRELVGVHAPRPLHRPRIRRHVDDGRELERFRARMKRYEWTEAWKVRITWGAIGAFACGCLFLQKWPGKILG
jgi:hypothetical protein